MHRSTSRFRLEILVFALALIALPLAAGAKEESKIQIRLTDLNGNGNGNGNGLGNGAVRADVRTHLQGPKVILQLRARGLEADTEYVLLCKDDETDGAADAAELARFTSRSNGSANLTQNLSKTDDPEAPADPRGKFLAIAEGADLETEIVGGWLYGEPNDDGPKTKIKEVTDLTADADASPSGNVAARYDMRPNGHGKLSISLQRVPVEDYEVLVDGVLATTLTPNPAGNAKADFQTKPIRGKGQGKAKAHKKKQQLNFDPRRKEILVQLTDGTPMFSGPMLAQIEGLNSCSPTSSVSPLEDGTSAGEATLELQENCETAFDVELGSEPTGMYDLYLDGVYTGGPVATFSFESVDDGSGTITGFVRFDPTPEGNEVPLDFTVGTGSLVEVFSEGADPDIEDPVLSGTLL